MNIQIKYLVIIVLVSAVLGGAITAKFVSGREVIKTETIEHTVVQNHVVTVVKEVDRPDGTKETTTTIDDNSVKHDASVSKSEDKKAVLAPNWMVSGGVGLDFNGSMDRVYQVSVSRRILGPVFLGAYGTTKSQAGLSIGFEF